MTRPQRPAPYLKAAAAIFLMAAPMAAGLFKLFQCFPMLTASGSQEAAAADAAFRRLLALEVPFFALILSAFIYIVVTRRARDNSPRGDSKALGGQRVQVLWVALSLAAVLGLGFYIARDYFLRRALAGGLKQDIDVRVLAAQWSWKFYYPDQKTYRTDLILPVGRRARLELVSEDTTHSFLIPAFHLHEEISFGRDSSIMVTPVRLGEYAILCGKFCGHYHSAMRSRVRVVGAAEFDRDIVRGGL